MFTYFRFTFNNNKIITICWKRYKEIWITITLSTFTLTFKQFYNLLICRFLFFYFYRIRVFRNVERIFLEVCSYNFFCESFICHFDKGIFFSLFQTAIKKRDCFFNCLFILKESGISTTQISTKQPTLMCVSYSSAYSCVFKIYQIFQYRNKSRSSKYFIC